MKKAREALCAPLRQMPSAAASPREPRALGGHEDEMFADAFAEGVMPMPKGHAGETFGPLALPRGKSPFKGGDVTKESTCVFGVGPAKLLAR